MRLERLSVGGFAATVLVEYARHYAPASLDLDPGLFTAPRADKALDVAATLGLLAALNLSALSLGTALTRAIPSTALARATPRTALAGDSAGGAPARDTDPPRSRGERALVALGLGLLALSYAVLALAALRLLERPILALLVAAPILLRARQGVRGLWRALRERGSELRALVPSPGALALAACAAVLLVPPFLAALAPSHGWDALTYHLALPERYLFENRIVVTPFSAASAWPLGTEMLYTLALALGDARLAVLLHFELGVLALATAALLAGRFSRRAAGLAPFFLLADPLVLAEMGWAYTDLAVAFHAGLAALLLCDWQLAPPGRARGALVCAGIFAGACAGARYTGAAVPLALGAALWLGARWQPRRHALACAWLALATLAVLAPWLARNVVATGNPVSPFLQGLFHAPGSEYFAPIAIEQHETFALLAGKGRGPGALLTAPWNVTLETVPGSYRDSFGYLIGPLHLIGIAALLAIRPLRRDPRARLLLCFVAAAFLVWFFSIQEVRYLLPIFPVTAALGAVAFDALLPEHPLRRAAGTLLLVPAAALALAQVPGLETLGTHYALVLGDAAPGEHLARDPAYRAIQKLRARLAPGDRVLLFYESRGFWLRGLDYVPFFIAEAAPTLQPVHAAGSADALRCALAERGVTHVLVNRALQRGVKKVAVEGYGPADFAADFERFDRLLAAWGIPVVSEESVHAFALRPAPGCGRAGSTVTP